MKKNKILLLIITTVCFIGLVGGSLWAGTEKKEEKEFYGKFMVGYRMVDTDGAETKYMEDINLEKGPRLFNFNLTYAPLGNMKKLFDQMDIRLNNFGGDPFETFAIEIRKYGKYQFQYDRRKSAYFYNDMLEAGDYHTFDFDRINDSGMLKVWLNKDFRAYIDFNRYTKKGESTTSFDFNRVEFEFDKPIDEMSTDFGLGLDYSGKWFSFVLEGKMQDYENANSMFLPGYADGGASARYPSAFYYYDLSMPYNMDGNTYTAKFSARPFACLLLRGSMQFVKQDTDFSYFEDSWGLDYLGYEFMYGDSGSGEFERKIQTYDFDMSYIINSKLAFVGAARYQNFEQTGTFTTTMESSAMDLKYETGSVEAGVQYQPTGKIGITLGFRYEKRDIEDEVEIENVNGPTERTGFFGTLNWRPAKVFKMTADYQYGSYENPYTLISPTDYHRFRLTAKAKLKSFYVTGSYLYNKSKSDENMLMWESSKNQLNLRLGFHTGKVKGSAGYSLIDVSREGDRTIYYPPAWSGGEGSFTWDILFDGTSNLFDAYLYFKLDKAWGLGGYFNYYENTGSWELSRSTLKAFAKYQFQCGFITQLGYRLVDFKEKKNGYNNYKANIFEISFGYRW